METKQTWEEVSLIYNSDNHDGKQTGKERMYSAKYWLD